MADNASAGEVYGRDVEGYAGIDWKRLRQLDAEAAGGTIAATAVAVEQFSFGPVPGDLHLAFQSGPLMKAAGAAPDQEHDGHSEESEHNQGDEGCESGMPERPLRKSACKKAETSDR
jgi:hypothetical protein